MRLAPEGNPDGLPDLCPDTDAGTPTTIYMRAYVMSYTTEIGGNDKVIEASVGLEIDAEPIEVAAAVTP